MNVIISIIATVIIIFTLSLLFTSPIIFILTKYSQYRLKKRLKERIKGSLLTSKLTWDKLTVFWKDIPDLKQKDVTDVLRVLLKDSYSGEVKELKGQEALLESYVNKSEEQDPLVDLPDDIRGLIERLLHDFPSLTISQLQPLVAHIRKMVSIYKVKSIIKTVVTIISFIITIASFIFGIYAYNHPKQQRIENPGISGTRT
jgi:hypothetical protein